MGANWIHGILGNPLYELASSNGLIELGQLPKPHNVAATTEDGRRVPFTVKIKKINFSKVEFCFLKPNFAVNQFCKNPILLQK